MAAATLGAGIGLLLTFSLSYGESGGLKHPIPEPVACVIGGAVAGVFAGAPLALFRRSWAPVGIAAGGFALMVAAVMAIRGQ